MKTIEHYIPLTISPQTLLDAWTRHSGNTTRYVGIPTASHHRLVFVLGEADDVVTDASEEELAGFIAGYVAAWQDHRKAALDRADNMLREIFTDDDDDTLILSDDDVVPPGWGSVDTSTDDDSPQMMPSPDQFR